MTLDKPADHHGFSDRDYVPYSQEGIQEVQRGNARISGDFAGVVTTSSHCLDVAVRIDDEVQLAALAPIIAAVLASAECSAGAKKDTKVHLWQSIQSILAVDDMRPEEVEATSPTRGSLNKVSFKRSSQSLAQIQLERCETDASDTLKLLDQKAKVLEIDYEAKENLVKQLMEERAFLKAKTKALENKLDDTLFSRLLHQMTGCLEGLLSLVLTPKPEEGQDKDGSHKRRPSSAESVTQNSQDLSWLADIQQGRKVLLDGHFAGVLMTRNHCIEIAVPLAAPVAGKPLLQILQDLHLAAADEKELPSRMLFPASVWADICSLVEAELDLGLSSDASSHASEERIKSLSEELHDVKVAYVALKHEASQLQSENKHLLDVLSSAEAAATRMREKLLEVGFPIGSSQGNESPVASREVSTPSRRAKLSSELQELERWASELSLLSRR